MGFRPPVEARLGGFFTESFSMASAVAGSSLEKPVASGWVSGWHKCIFVWNWGDKWFFTSLSLMMLTAAPVDRLLAWKTLVWS
jgi:hypothetical protein